jgi:glycosyltransferase involved in cell wall biosynthesis
VSNSKTFRIVQVIASLDPTVGGPPSSAMQTALALRAAGVAGNEFVFLYDGALGEGELANARLLEAAGVRTHAIPNARLPGRLGWRWAISLKEVVWLIRNVRRFDVVHLHAAWTFTALSGLLVARLFGRVAVLSTHESLTDFDRRKSPAYMRLVKRLLRPLCLRAFDAIIVSSRLEQRDSGDPEGRVTRVVPHAVRPISPGPRNAHSAFRLGYLGRLHPKKNVPVLLDALTRVDDSVELLIAGDSRDAYREEILCRISELGLDGRVTWLGFVDAAGKRNLFASVDALALPSSYECFGMAATEALSAGVPLILSPTVGVAEVVERRGAGLVATASPDALAEAIMRFASDPEFLAACSAAARETAVEEFSPVRHGELMLRAYRDALAARKRLLRRVA